MKPNGHFSYPFLAYFPAHRLWFFPHQVLPTFWAGGTPLQCPWCVFKNSHLGESWALGHTASSMEHWGNIGHFPCKALAFRWPSNAINQGELQTLSVLWFPDRREGGRSRGKTWSNHLFCCSNNWSRQEKRCSSAPQLHLIYWALKLNILPAMGAIEAWETLLQAAQDGVLLHPLQA